MRAPTTPLLRPFVDRAALEGPPEAATHAIIVLVNALRAQLWHEDEIPELLWELYFADLYDMEVQNGGHSQFFYNLGPQRSRLVTRVRAGLVRVGAVENVAILDAAIAVVTRDPKLITRLDETRYWGAAAEVSPSFAAVDTAHFRVPAEVAWLARCKAWLVATDEVDRIDAAEHGARLDALAAVVPDRALRAAEAKAAREAAMPAFERAIVQACTERGVGYEGLTAGRPLPGGVCWSFFASGRRREADVDASGALGAIRWDP
jgi:hypothetical protein